MLKLNFVFTTSSLISRSDKVELIATYFFSNPAIVWVTLSNILKVASPILWGSIYIFDLKMITFMLKVAIEDYCLVIWTLLLQLFIVLYALIIDFDLII